MKKRGSFSGKIGFIAAAAGSAVGLGNIWKFPYEVGAGGGAAFVLVYLVCAFVICMPIMIAEITMGRHAQLNPYGTFRKIGSRRWGLVGLWGILCGIMILSFYNVVAGWAFGYFIQISFGDLLTGFSNSEVEASAYFGGYFGNYIADFSDNLIYSFVFMLFTALIVAGGVQKGIERFTKILMPALIFIIVGLIIYTLTLEGAFKGVEFYLLPELDELTVDVVYSALAQAFFSLSLGMGALITYGSYFGKKDNIVNSAVLVTTADLTIAFLAGLLIFPLVFSQGVAPGEGPALVFVALPGVFESMGPEMGRVIGGSFFLLLCFAALTSTISLLEVPTAYITDEFKIRRLPAVIGLALLIFVIGLGSMLSQGAVENLTNFTRYGSATAHIDPETLTPDNNAALEDLRGQDVFIIQNFDPGQVTYDKDSDAKGRITDIGIEDEKIVTVEVESNGHTDVLSGSDLQKIYWDYTPYRSFMDVIIDLFSDIGLPLGGLLISLFVAYRWRRFNFAREIEEGYPGFSRSREERFIHIMLAYISPAFVGAILLITFFNKLLGIDLLGLF